MENNEKSKKLPDFSREKGNVEIVGKDQDKTVITTPYMDDSVCVSEEGIDVKKSGNLVIGTLNIIASPIKETWKGRHEKHYKESNFHLIADIILALLVVGLLVFFLVIKNLDPEVDLGLKVSLSDNHASSGDIEIFEIEYNNPSNFPITGASISVRLPENFSLKKTAPADIWRETAATFAIGDLPAGAGGKVKIEGVVLGEVGSMQALNTSFNYKIGQKMNNVLESLVYSIEDSSLALSVEVPKDIYKDAIFRGRLIVQNNSTEDVSGDLEVVLRNSGVKIEGIDSDRASLINNAIIIPIPAAGKKAVIDFKALALMESETSELIWESYLKTENKSIKQGEVKNGFKVIVPKLSLQIASDKNVIAENELVKFILNYENKEAANLDNVKLFFNTIDSAFRIDEFSVAADPRYRVSGSDLLFTGPIKAGETGTLEIEASFERKNASTNQEVGLMASLNYDFASEQISREIYSNNIKFLSDLQVSSKGVYYSAQGDQLGIGPLPPIVDVPTRYWVFWEVANLGNRLENLSVTAVLPDNVYWTDQKSLIAGKIRYGEMAKKAVWSVDEVAAEGGEYRAGFEVELIPTAADAGKVVEILKDIEYSAFDTFAGKEISGSLSALNTDLHDDSVASGQGKVLKMNVTR